MEGGIDIAGMRKPAGSVSMEPAIIPRPVPPSRARNLLRHEGERRNDLSSPLCERKNRENCAVYKEENTKISSEDAT